MNLTVPIDRRHLAKELSSLVELSNSRTRFMRAGRTIHEAYGLKRWTSNSRRAQGLSRYNTLKYYYTHTAHVLPLTQAITHTTLALTQIITYADLPRTTKRRTRALSFSPSLLSHTHTCTHSFNDIHTHTFATPDCFVFRSRNCRIVA